jgi:hypothetical protein
MSLPSDAGSPALPLDPDTLRRVETYAQAVGTTPAQIFREAVEEYLCARGEARDPRPSAETVFDVLHRAGLIGCISGSSGSPTDLSTNPIHMEGFGGE